MYKDNKSSNKDIDIEDSRAPLISHLIELRDRLKWAVIFFFIAFCFCYYFATDIYKFLVAPLYDIYLEKGIDNPRMIYTALTEAFFTFLKVSFYGALFISFPIIALQIYKFAAPGLYKEEKKAFLPFLVATPLLFASGAALVYYFIFPLAWRFFLGFQTNTIDSGMAIELEAKVNEYLSLVLKLMFAFGLAFQIPVALTLLSRAGLVSSDDLKRRRKYAIVLAFIVAAILTPPDLISQIGLGIPIIILFEISILLAKLFEKKKDQNNKKNKMKKNIGDTDYNE